MDAIVVSLDCGRQYTGVSVSTHNRSAVDPCFVHVGVLDVPIGAPGQKIATAVEGLQAYLDTEVERVLEAWRGSLAVCFVYEVCPFVDNHVVRAMTDAVHAKAQARGYRAVPLQPAQKRTRSGDKKQSEADARSALIRSSAPGVLDAFDALDRKHDCADAINMDVFVATERARGRDLLANPPSPSKARKAMHAARARSNKTARAAEVRARALKVKVAAKAKK